MKSPESVSTPYTAVQMKVLARAISTIEDYAIFLLDEKGCIASWNRGAERFKGYKAEEIVGKHFSIFYTKPDLDTDKPRRELEIAKETGRYEEEGWRLRKDGTTFWANVVITAVFDDDRTLLGFCKVTRDLSERRRVEEALRQSEERFRMVVENVQDYAIFMLDPTGHVATWNAGAERFKGYKAREIIGSHFSRFYPPEDRDVKPEQTLRLAAAEGRCIDEGWRVRKDGSRFWAYVVLTAIRDKDWKLVGFSKITRDLTERRLAEEMLQKANADLEKRVEQRTTELLESNKQLEQFAYVASHDLQEPLRKVIAFSERLREFVADAQPAEYLEKVHRSAERMRSVIEDLLDYSRLQSADVRKAPTDLNDTLKDVLFDLEYKIGETRAVIRAQELPRANVNPSTMRHLFQNIVLNSLKFSKSGLPPQIEISGRKAPDGTVEVRFKDYGIGFDPRYSTEIFKPFHRLHSKHEYEGSGIGLALCQRIAQQHGGKITAHGEPGIGAEFVLTLPA